MYTSSALSRTVPPIYVLLRATSPSPPIGQYHHDTAPQTPDDLDCGAPRRGLVRYPVTRWRPRFTRNHKSTSLILRTAMREMNLRPSAMFPVSLNPYSIDTHTHGIKPQIRSRSAEALARKTIEF